MSLLLQAWCSILWSLISWSRTTGMNDEVTNFCPQKMLQPLDWPGICWHCQCWHSSRSTPQRLYVEGLVPRVALLGETYEAHARTGTPHILFVPLNYSGSDFEPSVVSVTVCLNLCSLQAWLEHPIWTVITKDSLQKLRQKTSQCSLWTTLCKSVESEKIWRGVTHTNNFRMINFK